MPGGNQRAGAGRNDRETQNRHGPAGEPLSNWPAGGEALTHALPIGSAV